MMTEEEGFIPISEVLDDIEESQVREDIDRLNFWHIFLTWTGLVILFGLFYYFLSSPEGTLRYTSSGEPVRSVLDAMYFSFVSATTTGFGDIVPTGTFKVIAVAEVVLGLILLAVVTSKLVSLKQDAIMSEIYHLSFRERMNGFRDNLLLYRQHLSDLMAKVEDGTVKRREVKEIYHVVSQFEDTLREILTMLKRSDRSTYTKDMDGVDVELLSNSIVSSFERSAQLLGLMNEEGLDWDRGVTVELFEQCTKRGRNIFDHICSSDTISKQVRKKLREDSERAMESVEEELPE